MGGITFGTDGWRAVMCEDFTFANVRTVVTAIAEHVRDRGHAGCGVVVAYDARFLSERFASEAASVLGAHGIQAFVTSRDAPTPVAAHAVVRGGRAGAIMFTASHNPPEYNGIKWIPEYGGPAMLEVTRDIEARIARIEADGAARRAGSERAAIEPATFDPRGEYFDHISRLVDLEAIRGARLRIVCDPLHGSGRGYLDALLGPGQVTVINDTRDALFGGGPPDPTEPRLAGLAAMMREAGAHLGLATDGDADRFGVMDEGGAFLAPNQVIPLLAAHLARRRGMRGATVRSVATSHMIDAVARACGLEPIETPVGFKFIAAEMRRTKVVIGGEESGGLSVGGHVPEKDGILACLLVAEMRAVTGRPLRESLRELMDEVGSFCSRRMDLRMPRAEADAAMEALRRDPPERVAGVPVARISSRDGVKAVLEDGSWFLVRASGTEPIVRVYAEASSEERLRAVLDAARAAVERRKSSEVGERP